MMNLLITYIAALRLTTRPPILFWKEFTSHALRKYFPLRNTVRDKEVIWAKMWISNC